MKAWRLERIGIDGLNLQDVPTPTPGPGQVVIQIRAMSLNYRDLLMVSGKYDPKLTLPMTPGSDGAGEIVAVGDGVDPGTIGARVAGAFMTGWFEGPYSRDKSRTALGAGSHPGTLAAQLVVDEGAAVRFPEHLSFEEAATLPCAGVTAWNALFGDKILRPGETVLVQGTGGVSMFALQFAVAAGARVVATSSSDEKLERVRELGAWRTINYRSNPNWGAEARKLSNGGVDCVVEVGGAGTLKQSMDAVKFGGRIELIGVLSGTGGEVPTTLMLHKGIHVRGIYVGSIEMFRAMNRAIEAATIRPVIGATYSFDHAPDAFRFLESAGHFGKIVVRV